MSRPTLENTLTGLFALATAGLGGAVLLDVVYSSLLRGGDPALLQRVFHAVSDLLLLLGAPTLLLGVLATAVSWERPRARRLLALSLLCLAVEFAVPMVVFPLAGISRLAPGPGLLPLLRVLPFAAASLLALAAFRRDG